MWWGCLDLNQGPIGYEPTALTTELHPLVGIDFELTQTHGLVCSRSTSLPPPQFCKHLLKHDFAKLEKTSTKSV